MVILRTFLEHLRLKSPKYLRTSSLGPKIRRFYIKKSVLYFVDAEMEKNNELTAPGTSCDDISDSFNFWTEAN